MKLYLLTQSEAFGYDTFDSIIVCANNKESAVRIHPRGDYHVFDERGKCGWIREDGSIDTTNPSSTWASDTRNIECKYLGEAAEGIEEGVVLASFNAG